MAKKALLLFIVFAIITASVLLFVASNNSVEAPTPDITSISNTSLMKITPSEFENNQNIPEKFTCDGENITPTLNFSDVPDETVSLVLISDDPDAPNGDWVHWLVWNISPDTNSIAENTTPTEGMQGTTSFGKPGYGGPCPPSGTHRYFFKLFALDIEVELTTDAKKTDLLSVMDGHILDEAELIGLYSRN